MTNALVQQLKGDEFAQRLAQAVPSMIGPERILSVALNAVNTNPRLMQAAAANPQSFFAALLTASSLGLEVNSPTGEAWLIPRKHHGTLTVQFQIGYLGLKELLWRSGQVRTIRAELLYEGDKYEDRLDGPPFYKPAEYSQRGEITGAFAMIALKGGGFQPCQMDKEEINEVRNKYSQAFNKSSSPWSSNWDAMAKKTCLIRAAKLAPLSAEIRTATALDERGTSDAPVVVAAPVFELSPELLAAAAQTRLGEIGAEASALVEGDTPTDAPVDDAEPSAPDSHPTGRGTPKEQVLAYIEEKGIPKRVGELAIEKALNGEKTAKAWKAIADDLPTFAAMCDFIAANELSMSQQELPG